MEVKEKKRDSAGRGRRYLGALPGGPGNHATAQRPDGRSGRFGIRRPRASSRPPHTKTARRFRAGLLLVAERAIEPNTLYAPLYNARRLILNAESSRKYYLIIAGDGVTLG